MDRCPSSKKTSRLMQRRSEEEAYFIVVCIHRYIHTIYYIHTFIYSISQVRKYFVKYTHSIYVKSK